MTFVFPSTFFFVLKFIKHPRALATTFVSREHCWHPVRCTHAQCVCGDVQSVSASAIYRIYSNSSRGYFNFSLIPVRLLIEGGSYSRAALTTFHIR